MMLFTNQVWARLYRAAAGRATVRTKEIFISLSTGFYSVDTKPRIYLTQLTSIHRVSHSIP